MAGPRINNWANISDREWDGILVGNGASIALWDKFVYSSIFDEAQKATNEHPLSRADLKLFSQFETRNFELVLSSLFIGGKVANALGLNTAKIVERYRSIREALFETIGNVHLSWINFPDVSKNIIRQELLNYENVFTTNYDLLIYWSIMADPHGAGFKDFFWGTEFNVSDTAIWDDAVRVYYLHGGLHLYKTSAGGTLKRSARDTGNLLDMFGRRYLRGAVPLFISEGSSRQKLESIYKSNYLSFAYERFKNHTGSLVVFGHSLDKQSDKHLVDVIESWGRREIAVSITPSTKFC